MHHMDVDIHVVSNPEIIKKRLFKLKAPSNDGLLLNIHHSSGNRKIRFIYACFHENGHILGIADNKGNGYIFNLKLCEFWTISKIDSCTFMSFSSLKPNELLIARKGGDIIVVDIDSALVVGTLCGHANSVEYLSFSKEYCLSSSQYEAIVWDLQSRSKIQVLNLDKNSLLKYVGFLPVSGNILACFQDDLIQVWNSQTFETIKQFLPSNWKNHAVKSITFTKNGEIMVVSGYLSTLAIFHLGNWKLLKSLSLPDGINTIRHTEFLSQPFDGGCNKILVVLSGQGVIYFHDIEQNSILSKLSSKCEIIRAVCSPNGNYLACILCSGEVQIYNLEQYVMPSIDVKVKKIGKSAKNISRNSKKHLENMEIVKEEIDEVLTNEKLESLLKEYGEFPQIHRIKIWEKLLQLPNNIRQYNSIINHVTLMAFDDLQRNYPLESKLSIKDLRKLLNNLVTWCPFFANVDYLPLFAYPFVKVFQNKPLACFEALCTIILNWCQHWFEYFPLPPVNILAMAENVLMEHDPELLHHFATNNITSNVYIWTLLETAFSEVLTSSEWLIFWDHVITNENSFLLCATTAYSISQRNILLALKTFEEYQYFYHNQNPVDMKKFLKITYRVLNSTSERIHPRQYLYTFRSIEKGNYPLFIEYPKAIIEFETERMKKLNGEMNELTNEKKHFNDQKDSKGLKEFNIDLQKEEDRRMKELKKLCEERLDQMERQVRTEQKMFEDMKNQASSEDYNKKNLENRVRKQKNTSIDKSVESLLKLKKLNMKTSLEIIDNFIKDIEKEIKINESKSHSGNSDTKPMNEDLVIGKSKNKILTPRKMTDNYERVIINDSNEYSNYRNRKSCCSADHCSKTVRFCESTDS